MKIRPMTGYILLKAIKKDKSKSGIILPEGHDKMSIKRGKVMAIGNAPIKKLGFRPGDIVIYDCFPRKIKDGDKEYLIVKYDDIIAVAK